VDGLPQRAVEDPGEASAPPIHFHIYNSPRYERVNQSAGTYTRVMFVIDVIPLSRTTLGLLSYRSSSNLSVGTIVHIPIRKTQTQGIVVSVTPVEDAKEMLKNARFMLSKSTPSPAGSIPKEYMQAAATAAQYHATSTGAVLTAMFAEHIKLGVELPVDSLSTGERFSTEEVELPLLDRTALYKTHIEKNLNAGMATLLVVATIAELQYWKQELKDCKPLAISGDVNGSRRVELLKKARTHTGLIISTPSFSWIPIQTLGSIIVDRVSAGTYTLSKRPYLQVGRCLRFLAEARSVPYIVSDFPLPLEYRHKPDQRPALTPSSITVIDARRDTESQTVDEEAWTVFPKIVRERMEEVLTSGQSVVVLATRKGYAPAVVCRDCGQTQTDERGVPLSFSMAGGSRVFVTSDGISVLNAKRSCQRCESWNLLPLGVGIERVEEEARKLFPQVSISVCAPETTNTPLKAKKALVAAQEQGGILIGTEAILPWLYAIPGSSGYALGVIASADSLLALPFWRARERFVRLAYFFSGVSTNTLLITRRPEDTAVQSISTPASAAFWGEETTLRRALSYPPFGTIITLTVEGSVAALEEQISGIQEYLGGYTSSVLPARPLGASKFTQTIVLLVPGTGWPDAELQQILTSLPPSVRVRIDPESLW
jgi:primosomal protein N'